MRELIDAFDVDGDGGLKCFEFVRMVAGSAHPPEAPPEAREAPRAAAAAPPGGPPSPPPSDAPRLAARIVDKLGAPPPPPMPMRMPSALSFEEEEEEDDDDDEDDDDQGEEAEGGELKRASASGDERGRGGDGDGGAASVLHELQDVIFRQERTMRETFKVPCPPLIRRLGRAAWWPTRPSGMSALGICRSDPKWSITPALFHLVISSGW